MALVSNAIVKMDWEVEGFFESKKDDTFVAATELYADNDGETLCVIFKDGKAFFLIDDETGKPMSRERFTEELHDVVTDEDRGVDYNFENDEEHYVEVSNGAEVDPDIAESFGLDEDVCNDILARIDDLSGYFEVEYEDM